MPTSSPSAGEIIYKAFVPILKMALCIVAGFVMTKAGSLTAPSIRGVSLITLNLALPCLIFASMVSAFTPETVSAFGPLVMMAVMYQTLGGLLALVVSEIFYVPNDFRWGILVMGIISNWGNLPTAVVQTVAKESPFNPETDVNLGVAYIAVFILVMNTTFFALGVHRICGWDFTSDRMLGDQLPFARRWRHRYTKLRSTVGALRHALCSSEVTEVQPHGMDVSNSKVSSHPSSLSINIDPCDDPAPATSLNCVPDPSACRQAEASSRLETIPENHSYGHIDASAPHPTLTPSYLILQQLRTIFLNVPSATWAVALGLLFSLVQPLKALLTITHGWTGTRMPNAPDNNPPLHFILDTTEYIGAMTVPLGLMLLGSSFARMKLPTRWKDLPVMAIVSMTAVKMIIVPIFSVFVVQALQKNTTLFPPHQKVRTFVTILLSGTPAAVNQLVVTQLYNPAGTAHTLASFLLLQYLLMFILSTALAAIALYIVK